MEELIISYIFPIVVVESEFVQTLKSCKELRYGETR